MKAMLSKTCSMCPEQYDVLGEDGKTIGYMRLRWGGFTVECPDVFGEAVYSCAVGDGFTGEFPDEETRNHHITEAINKIGEYYGTELELDTFVRR